MICIKCGKELPGGAPFCPWCGKKQTPEKRKALKRANGMGTVYKLSGRRTRPWVAAKKRTIVGYYAKKTEALEALERLSGKDISARYNMTFAEVFSEWKVEHYREIGDSSADSYDWAFAQFTRLHGQKFRSLRTLDFQSVIDDNAGLSRSSLVKFKLLISQMAEWAIREEICTSNFAKYVVLPDSVKKEKEIFSAKDIQKLEADGSPAAKIVLMLIFTGMRIGELFSLPVDAWHGAYVIGGKKTEAGRNRIIPIRPEGQRYFSEMAARADGELLISGYSGQKVAANFRRRDYYPLLERLGICKKTPHATRHTFASWAVSAGIKPELLQRMLGHASYETTTNTYFHANAEQLVAEINRVSNLLVTDAE